MRRYPFGKFLLQIPDDHKIVSIHREAAFYDRAFGFILEEIASVSPDGVMLDIGGNVGDTAAFLATYVHNPIVSVEGNPHYIGYFRSNLQTLGSQVRLIEKFVRTDALAELRLGYVNDDGSGSLFLSSDDALHDEDFITTDGLLAEVGTPSLIKCDTDGMDGFIILDMLSKAPDVPLFFECDTILTLRGAANPWPDLFDRLNGYSVLIFDNQGLPMLAARENAGQLVRDLSGYVHLQRGVHPVRTHYLDVWAFPMSWSATFDRVAERLRSDMLKPYAF